MALKVRRAQKLPPRQTRHLTIACLVLTAITRRSGIEDAGDLAPIMLEFGACAN